MEAGAARRGRAIYLGDSTGVSDRGAAANLSVRLAGIKEDT
jgi:hypothetical protein